MKFFRLFLFFFLTLFFLTSCSEDGDTFFDVNNPPKVENNKFTIFESFREIGTIKTSDIENDTLTLSISGGSDSDKFNLSSDGNLSFNFTTDDDNATDHDTNNIYEVTLMISDGVNTVYEDIEVNVTAITHHSIEYDLVVSPTTQKTWIDRNLGSSRVCTAYNDSQCYGYYFQWGRGHDGHQVSNSTRINTQSTTLDVNHSNFIENNGDKDWTTDNNYSKRIENWAKTDGSSICPKGFRVPTNAELLNELPNNTIADNTARAQLFNNFLKVPTAGYRPSFNVSGDIVELGDRGRIWSNTNSSYYSIGENFITESQTPAELASGYSVRCLKD